MNKKFESTRVDDKQRVRIHKKRKMFLKKYFFLDVSETKGFYF